MTAGLVLALGLWHFDLLSLLCLVVGSFFWGGPSAVGGLALGFRFRVKVRVRIRVKVRVRVMG